MAGGISVWSKRDQQLEGYRGLRFSLARMHRKCLGIPSFSFPPKIVPGSTNLYYSNEKSLLLIVERLPSFLMLKELPKELETKQEEFDGIEEYSPPPFTFLDKVFDFILRFM